MRKVVKAVYTSKITQAGALLADTRTLLTQWDNTETVSQNLRRFQSQNVLGKASRIRANRVLKVFRERYLGEEAVIASLAALAEGGIPSQILNPILYFYTARSDRLLHDIVTEFLVGVKGAGITEIDSEDILGVIRKWSGEGKTSGQWANGTLNRIATGLLSTLRDFGVLEGAVNKRLTPVYLPIESFAYVARYLIDTQPSGERLIHDPEWRLFFLSPQGVEYHFLRAQQHGLLEYHAAGSIIRVAFPAESLEEYANVILRAASRTA